MPGIGLRSALTRANGFDRALRVVGARQPHVDVRSRVGQDLRHVGVHAASMSSDRVEAAGHTPLVGADRDRHVCGVESRDRLDGTVDEVDPLDRADVAVVDDDRAVPVKQDTRPAHVSAGPLDPRAAIFIVSTPLDD